MNKVIHSQYKITKTKCLKNKNLSLDMILQSMFNFTYAGKCQIFIKTSYDKFQVVHQGIHIVEDIFLFTPNFYKRFTFDSLYQAVVAFNKTVQFITSSMDWFEPEVFKGTALYDQITIKE